MRKVLYLAVVGVATAGWLLAAPSESRADHRHGSSLSLGVGNGGFHFDYNRGRGYYPGAGILPGGCVVPDYGVPGYGGYYSRRPVLVEPTELHWSPYRGWHEHGRILVPHRGHYHSYRY